MRRLAAFVLAWACCTPALAQERAAEPSEAQRCLQHRDGPAAQPQYPIEAYNHNRGGRVNVELEFRHAERAPAVRVLLHEGQDDLLEAVQAHVRDLRVPCLAPGAPSARLQQAYVFQADQRQVHWSRTVDPNAEERDQAWGCLIHRSGFRTLAFPERALRTEAQGRVLLRLTFASADAAPEVEAFSRPLMSELASEASRLALDFRLPCMSPGPPLTAVFTYVFVLNGDRYGFRDVSLLEFMAGTRGVRRQTLQFNTHEMGCPFELQMQYRQPHLRNRVGEPGEPVPARRPLLEWLAQAELDLQPHLLDAAYGDVFKLTVPCLRLNIKPKEK
jgi:hypothetical protein